jgi:hypothetical protein
MANALPSYLLFSASYGGLVQGLGTYVALTESQPPALSIQPFSNIAGHRHAIAFASSDSHVKMSGTSLNVAAHWSWSGVFNAMGSTIIQGNTTAGRNIINTSTSLSSSMLLCILSGARWVGSFPTL